MINLLMYNFSVIIFLPYRYVFPLSTLISILTCLFQYTPANYDLNDTEKSHWMILVQYFILLLAIDLFVHFNMLIAFVEKSIYEEAKDNLMLIHDNLPDGVILLRLDSVPNQQSYLNATNISVGNVGGVHYRPLYCNK